MKVEIWFDYVCPYCYLGERKFQLALDKFEHKDKVEIIYRSFELNTEQQNAEGQSIHQLIADKYQVSYEQIKRSNDRLALAGKEVGLHFDFEQMKLNNTNFAHQITQFAKKDKKEHNFILRAMKAYFEQGMNIGNQDALLKIAEESGLHIEKLKFELQDDKLLQSVRAEEAEAFRRGIDTIPHFLFDGKHSIIGAEDESVFLNMLRKVYQEQNS